MKSISLEKIMNFSGNRYELTNAVIKRAKQISQIGDPELEEYGFKLVSLANDQILSEKVLYRLQE
jgi:DNA-directed RNA polymerase subunit K/omega